MEEGMDRGSLVCPFIFFAIHLRFVDESLDTLEPQADAVFTYSLEIWKSPMF
jgi:hypothetical protein